MAIVAALQALPVAERRAIVLHHVAGLSVVDIASELRAPEGTVKSWLSRGRSRLASELDRPEQKPRRQVAPPDVVVDPRKDPADD
jgi:RNA polymerase sigma-70 factor (ECF subfamily)